jgi:dTMP kinase
MSRGKFITLEGIDGAGKSTHLGSVARILREQGKDVIVTREPGGTGLGEKLRELLLSQAMHIETETLLMFAARQEHIAEVIEPALSAGRWVVSDRFTDATYAYQGAGRGLDSDRLAVLERWVQGELRPDLTIVVDVPVELAASRIASLRTDRFEKEDPEFFGRVRRAYLERAAMEPQRVRIVDGSKPLPILHKEVEELLRSICY